MNEPNTSNLKATNFVSGDSYVGVLGTNIVNPEQVKTSRDKLLFEATRASSEAGSSGGLGSGIDVPSGASVLMGGIGDWQIGEIADCWMIVQKPNGSYVNQASATNESGHLVLLPTLSAPENSVLAFVIIDPEPGTWQVTIGSSGGAPAFQAMVSTIPQSQTPVTVVDDTIYGLATDPSAWHQTSDVSFATESWDWECDACKVGAYGLALCITAAIAGISAAVLTAEAAIVVATAGFLGVTAPVALGLIVGLVAVGTLTTDFVLTNLCTWAGACD